MKYLMENLEEIRAKLKDGNLFGEEINSVEEEIVASYHLGRQEMFGQMYNQEQFDVNRIKIDHILRDKDIAHRISAIISIALAVIITGIYSYFYFN